jgi:hypothetical protein
LAQLHSPVGLPVAPTDETSAAPGPQLPQVRGGRWPHQTFALQPFLLQ